MRYLIYLLIILACFEIVFAKLHNEISIIDGEKRSGVYEYVNRNKRDISIYKDSDSLAVKAIKYIFNNGDKQLGVVGNVKGLKDGSYDSIDAGLSFADRNGDNLNVFALHDNTGNKLIGKGNINILNTDTQDLKADGFVIKDLSSKSGQNVFKYGGTLDYINKNKFNGKVSAEHDSDIGDKLTANAIYNIFRTGNKDLSGTGYWDRSTPVHGTTVNNYGGSLDYSHGNKFIGQFLAQHDSNFGDKLTARAKYNIINSENQDLIARGFWGRSMPFNKPSLDNYGGTLDYVNKNGNRASLNAEHIPNYGEVISAFGKYNMLHNDDHDIGLSLGASKTFSSNPDDNINTFSGSLDYNYKDKFAAKLGIKHSSDSDSTDVSLYSKLKFLPKSYGEVDVFATASKSGDQSSFKPAFGITFQKEF